MPCYNLSLCHHFGRIHTEILYISDLSPFLKDNELFWFLNQTYDAEGHTWEKKDTKNREDMGYISALVVMSLWGWLNPKYFWQFHKTQFIFK